MYFIVIALHQSAFSETEIVTKGSLLATKLYLSCVSDADLFPFSERFKHDTPCHCSSGMRILFTFS